MIPTPEILTYLPEELKDVTFLVETPDDYANVYYDSLPEAETAVKKWQKGVALHKMVWGDIEEFTIVSRSTLDDGIQHGRIVGTATYVDAADEHLFQFQEWVKIRWEDGKETDWLDHEHTKGITYHTDKDLWWIDED
jgi:hypothetical protein